jgi:hypothetical protein
MGTARRHLLCVVILLAACGAAPAGPALDTAVPIATTARTPAPSPLVTSLPPAEKAQFDTQIAAALDAAKRLTTTADAAAAGYQQSSTQLPGIGTHWINWSLLDKPFDAAHPSMLLYDQSPLHPTRLAGFSYWVRSNGPPDGFAGPNDVWHRHSGLCFENGFLTGENTTQAACAGQWYDGSDLWMLHAWVAPGLPNVNGVFAPRNTALCPPYWQKIPDMFKCGADAGSHGEGTTPIADSNAYYCHLPST